MRIILQQIPELEVIAPEAKETITPVIDRVLYDGNPDEKKKFVVPPQLSKGAKRRHRKRFSRSERESESDSKIGSNFNESDDFKISTETDVGANAVALDSTVPLTPDPGIRSSRKSTRVHSSQRQRQRKKDSSSQMEAFKIALGGLLAFPIAYLIIMWVFGLDPLSLGQSVGKVVPFAFPEAFRSSTEKPKDDAKADDSESVASKKNDNGSTAPNRNEITPKKKPDPPSFDLNLPPSDLENKVLDVAPAGEKETENNDGKK